MGINPALTAAAFLAAMLTMPVAPTAAQSLVTPTMELSFGAGSLTGAAPDRSGLVRAADGSYYGTTSRGGSFDHGTVYRVDPHGQAATIADFPGGQGGSAPCFPLTAASTGPLYGLTCGGGASGLGMIFRLDDFQGPARPFYSFSEADAGQVVTTSPLLLAADGHLYGLRGQWLYRVRADAVSPSLEKLHQFAGGSDGLNPQDALAERNGVVYGTTVRAGDHGQGTIFSYDMRTGAYAVVQQFRFTRGARSQAGLTLGADGALYGASTATLFRYDVRTGRSSRLHDFFAAFEGSSPSYLTSGGVGLFGYATNSQNAVFALPESGVFSTVQWMGRQKMTGPLAIGQNSIWGTTENGGALGLGSVFELSATGKSPVGAWINVTPTFVRSGETYTIGWSTNGADTCEGSGPFFDGPQLISGSITIVGQPLDAGQHVYKLLCFGDGRLSSSSDSTVLTVAR